MVGNPRENRRCEERRHFPRCSESEPILAPNVHIGSDVGDDERQDEVMATATKTVHWSEIPTVSTLGGWDLELSPRGVAAFQFLVVRLSQKIGTERAKAQLAEQAQKTALRGYSAEASLELEAELKWKLEEKTA